MARLPVRARVKAARTVRDLLSPTDPTDPAQLMPSDAGASIIDPDSELVSGAIVGVLARRVGLTHTPDERARQAIGRTRKQSAESTILMSGKAIPSSRYRGRRRTHAAMIVYRSSGISTPTMTFSGCSRPASQAVQLAGSGAID